MLCWLALVALAPGCAYKIGSGVTAGMLDEISGEGRSAGVGTMGDRVLERALLVELGHQLGEGIRTGAADVTPEQQKNLENVIDGLLTVAAERAGKGLRNEVTPELRAMVQAGIVDALSDGLRGELGDSLEETVDRVVHQAVVSLRLAMAEEDTRTITADLIRESVYYAMREGQGVTPAVGETIEFTLTENMLQPLEESVGGITDRVAVQVEEQYRRTERLLYGIIGVLVVGTMVLSGAYIIRGFRLQRVEKGAIEAEVKLGSLDVALEGLDDATKAQIKGKLGAGNKTTPAPKRSDDYMR